MNIKKAIATWMYRVARLRFLRLEQYIESELRRILQDEQFKLAEEKIRGYHERKRLGVDYTEGLPNLDFNPDTCNHLKGGRLRTVIKDYAVRYHLFVDGHPTVECTICRKTWDPQSPDWKTAVDMVRQSSNTPSSSEVAFEGYEKSYIQVRDKIKGTNDGPDNLPQQLS